MENERKNVVDFNEAVKIADDMSDNLGGNRLEAKAAALRLFQPTGDIIEDARTYYDLRGLKYENGHIGSLLESRNEDYIVDQLEYILSAEDRNVFENDDCYFASRYAIRSILGAYENRKKKSLDIGEIAPGEWNEYKQIRLEALEVDPAAFGAVYAEEAKKMDNDWQVMVARFQDENSKRKMFAVREQNKFVGMGGFFWSAPKTARIFEVYVKEDFRNKGVGRSLLKKIIADLEQDAKFEKVELIVFGSQKKAIELYEKLGFVVAEMIKASGSDLQSKYLMIKHLNNDSKVA